MKNNATVLKSNLFNQLIVALFAISLPITAAFAGACCAGHGGATSTCTNGFKQCKDNTVSPTCACKMPKAAKKPTKKTKTTTMTNTTVKKSSIKTKATTNPTTTMSPKGCCSHHGGIASCNKSTGFQMCNDGSNSPSCKCN